MRESHSLDNLRVKLFCDGASLHTMAAMAMNPWIRGFTTNPTLMRKAGVEDYEEFARMVLAAVPNHPVSLEVFADDLEEMYYQARVIAGWGSNANVKIPVTNTQGEFTGKVIAELSSEGIVVNVTAVLTTEQVRRIARALAPNVPAIVSVFAGRIADTGVDPLPIMASCLDILSVRPMAQLLWASPREVLNVVQADEIGCHIITATPDILSKLPLLGKNLRDYSLETVRMFRDDAMAAGYSIAVEPPRGVEAPQKHEHPGNELRLHA